jgi:RNA recognition motif-containing protein
MKNIFVGNLDFGTTEESLRQLFAEYEADKAINALNGFFQGGRALNVNEARPKVERGAGDRGGPRQRREPRW